MCSPNSHELISEKSFEICQTLVLVKLKDQMTVRVGFVTLDIFKWVFPLVHVWRHWNSLV